MWRDRPDPNTFNPFLLSITRAVLAMPALQTLRVSLHMKGHCQSFLAEFLTPGTVGVGYKTRPVFEITKFDSIYQGQRRWVVILDPPRGLATGEEEGSAWEVPEAIKAAWKASVDNRVFLCMEDRVEL